MDFHFSHEKEQFRRAVRTFLPMELPVQKDTEGTEDSNWKLTLEIRKKLAKSMLTSPSMSWRYRIHHGARLTLVH